MKRFLNKQFILAEAGCCFLSMWKFLYVRANISMRNKEITTVPISVDFDVRCNVLKPLKNTVFWPTLIRRQIIMTVQVF